MTNDGSGATTRMLRRSAVGTLACLLGAIALAACTPTDPPESTPTPTAIFASEDEALAAATDVYQQYLAVSDQVSADGGDDAERLAPFLTDEYWPVEAKSLEQLRSSGVYTDGATTFDGTELADLSQDMTIVTIHLCADVSNVRVMNSTGENVTPEDRPNRIPLEVELQVEERGGPLLIARSDVWSDTTAC